VMQQRQMVLPESRRSAKKAVSRAADSSARTPAVHATSWLSRGSLHRL